MDRKTVGLAPPLYERQLPYFDELTNLYGALGRLVAESTSTLEPTEDALAEKIITRNPAFEPEGDLHEPLMRALMADDDKADAEAMNAGIEIASHIVENARNTRGIVTGYLNACFEVDRLKIGACGFHGAVNREHMILFFTRQMLLDDIPADDRSVRIVNNVSSVVHDLNHKADFFGWFMPKMAQLAQEVVARTQAKQAAEKFTPVSEESIQQYGGSELLEDDIRDFTEQTMRNRKYGVKAAYTEASIGGSWVYYDADDYASLFPVAINPAYAALVFHTPLSELSNLKLDSQAVEYKNGGKGHFVTGAVAEMKPDARYVIGYDGELYVDDSLLEPLRRLLEDQPGVYEALQAEIIANLHDLVVPAAVVEAERKPNFGELTDKEKEAYDPVLQLLLPRLKKRYQGPAPEEQGTRSIREHDVTWFVRKLPKGWKASLEAIGLAQKHNIKLESDETFVRQHKRGAGNAVAGHQIKQR